MVRSFIVVVIPQLCSMLLLGVFAAFFNFLSRLRLCCTENRDGGLWEVSLNTVGVSLLECFVSY